MKAVVMTAVGGPEVLQYQDAADPVIRHETEILVRLKAAGVNPVDTKLRGKGTYYPDQLPAILGCDGAGVVAAVGSLVRRFKVEDEVYFCNGGIGGAPGTYAQYAVIDEAFVAHKPVTLDFTEAAAVPLVLITAWESLHDRGKVQQGQSVLIHAGAGGVGHVAVQLAKHAGAWVCTTVSSEAKAKFVRDLGADEAIPYRDKDFTRAVLDWSEGDGVELALDTVGGDTFVKTFPAVRFYGDIITLLQPDATTDWTVARQRNLRITYELMLTPMYYALRERQRRQAEILEQATRMFDTGKLRIHVERCYPLAEAAQAHRDLAQGGITGKLVLAID